MATLPLQPTADDIAHLENAHQRKYNPHLQVPGNPIRERIIMERAVIRRAIADAIAAGNWVRIFYGQDEGYGCARTDNIDVAMDAVGACDEEWLHVFPNSSDKRLGFAMFVFGNAGYEVIADYSGTDRMELLMAGANNLSDELADAMYAPVSNPGAMDAARAFAAGVFGAPLER